MTEAGGGGGSHVLTVFEAEAMVEQLQIFDIKSIGSPKWLAQHEYLEKLNVQSHVNVQDETDDFVSEALISFQKLPILVHELIAVEVWRERVYPELVEMDFVEKSSMTAYIVRYHEATVISLLECILFDRESVEACEDSVLDLMDYCYRHILYLVSLPEYDPDEDVPLTTKAALEQTSQEQLDDQIKGLPFDIATKAVSIMRYLVDHHSALPLSCITRMVNTHDLPCTMVPLVARSPWDRRKEDGTLQRYVDGAWADVEPGDLHKLTKTQAQAWLALYTLIQDPEIRKKYNINSHNKEELLRLRAFFTDVLLDQIPVLNELRRTLEELSLMEPAAAESVMILEQLPEIREHLMKVNAKKWRKLAEFQKATVFCADKATLQAQAQRLAGTYDLDMLESLLPEDPKCAACGEVATFRCSRCKNEWYCRRQCQVESWKKHKKMCNLLHDSLQEVKLCTPVDNPGDPSNYRRALEGMSKIGAVH